MAEEACSLHDQDAKEKKDTRLPQSLSKVYFRNLQPPIRPHLLTPRIQTWITAESIWRLKHLTTALSLLIVPLYSSCLMDKTSKRSCHQICPTSWQLSIKNWPLLPYTLFRTTQKTPSPVISPSRLLPVSVVWLSLAAASWIRLTLTICMFLWHGGWQFGLSWAGWFFCTCVSGLLAAQLGWDDVL